MNIEIRKSDITGLHVDCIVNAANEHLAAGGGVCGAIFSKAGHTQLANACDAFGYCKSGHAVITPGFKLPAKYIIHAVGPVWRGGTNNEEKLLYSAYKRSLEQAVANDCHTIAVPLISAGIFGFPLDRAWRKALQACIDFGKDNQDYKLDVIFAVIDDTILAAGQAELDRQMPDSKHSI